MSSKSLIAGANAEFRHMETTQAASTRILEDQYAKMFMEDSIKIRSLRALKAIFPPFTKLVNQLKNAHCVRHITIETLVTKSISSGFEQIIIIGAGYDTKCLRLDHKNVNIFEVDHPATQERKLQVLKQNQISAINTTFVPLILGTDDFLETIIPYIDQEKNTCIVAEGLIHYLERDFLSQFFSEIAALAPASRLQFIASWISHEIYNIGKKSRLRSYLKFLKETPTLHFSVDELRAELNEQGFTGTFYNWTHKEQVKEFSPQATSKTVDVAQDVFQVNR